MSGTEEDTDEDISVDGLRFNQDGLIPVIVQQHDSKEVLMFAWMNKESLERTISTGNAVYWSRSRKNLWRKGETSGHVQKVVSLFADCDRDCLLLIVEQTGAACHTNRRTCFFRKFNGSAFTVTSQQSND